MSGPLKQTVQDVMEWGSGVPPAGNYLQGWIAILAYDTPSLNTLLVSLQQNQRDGLDETISVENPISPGVTWRRIVSRLSRGQLVVHESEWGESLLTLRKQIADHLEITLVKSGPLPIRYPVSIKCLAPASALQLCIDFNMIDNGCEIATGGAVKVSWAKSPKFYLIDAYGGNRDEAGAHGLAQHYLGLPDASKSFVVTRGEPFAAVRPLKMIIRTHRAGPEAHQTLVYLGAPGGAMGALPSNSAAQRYLVVNVGPSKPLFPIPHLATLQMSTGALRAAGFTEQGITRLADLLVGREGESWTLDGGDMGSRESERLSFTVAQIIRSSPASADTYTAYAANPAFAVVNAGDDGYPLSTLPVTENVTWEFSGSAQGSLHKSTQGQWSYKPVAAPTPELQLDNNAKTLEPCVLKSSMASLPIAVDTLQARIADHQYASLMTVLRAIPTHFLRLSKQQEHLCLSLRYINTDDIEVEVAPSIVQWHVVAGNGSVSNDGVFRPATSSPSAYTVLAAVEPDTRKWYWCWILIPTGSMSVDEIISLYSV